MKNTVDFWNWFVIHHEKFRNIQEQEMGTINQLLDELIAELKKYSEGLFVEIGGKAEPFELIITPQGNKAYFSDAEYLVMKAPPLAGWTFIALKPAHGVDFNFKMGDMELHADAIYFIPLEDEDEEKIGVQILHKDYQTADIEKQNALINGLYYCLDSVLGEKAVTLDISFMDFDTLPDDFTEHNHNLLPVTELKNYIAWKKKERKSYEVKFPEPEVTLLEGKIEDKPVLIQVNRNYRYYNYTADYPYLLKTFLRYQARPADGLPEDDLQQIYDAEEMIVSGTAVCGHYIVSETYHGTRTIYCYIDTYENAMALAAENRLKVSTHRLDADITYDKYWVGIDDFM